VFAHIDEINKHQLTEQELAGQDQLYRILFELSPTGLLLEDLSGHILDVNPAFCNSLGYKKVDLIGQHVDILVHPDMLAQVVDNINELKEGKILKHHEKSVRKDGSICFMELHESKISLPDGKEGILCIANDVTEKLSAEADRVQKDRMKGVLEMAGAVCHELNQPMTVVSVNTEIISENMDKDQLREKLLVIKDEIRKMSKITRKLMHITRYETREYLNGHIILDIDKSVSENEKDHQ
jgi:PAS domain S-box-containing protein